MLEYVLLSQMAYTQTAADAASAKGTARSAAHEVVRLEQRLAAAELMVETLARAVVRAGVLTEDELFALARTVDLEDGILDGRRDMNKLRKICPSCHRANPTERPRCMWCGHGIVEVKPERAPNS